MNVYVYILIMLTFSSLIQAADGTLMCRLGCPEDIPGILEQYEKAEKNMDADKIVVLPKAFRESSLLASMQKQRLFVAVEGDKVLGFKKLFLLSDRERHEVLSDEIRCRESSVCAGFVNRNSLDLVSVMTNQDFDDSGIVVIYSGGSFTDPGCRGKGVNSQLLKFALKRAKEEIIKQLLISETKGLALSYGLTEANAGEGILGGANAGFAGSIHRDYA